MNLPAIFLVAVLAVSFEARAALRVPAFTAYLDPDVEGARVSPRSGIVGWKNPALKIPCFGDLEALLLDGPPAAEAPSDLDLPDLPGPEASR